MAEVRQAHHVESMQLSGGPTFQFITDWHHPIGGPVTMIAPCSIRTQAMRLSVPLSAAPRYGEHTVEVLAEIGVDAAPLLARGVAATSWSTEYLPFFQPGSGLRMLPSPVGDLRNRCMRRAATAAAVVLSAAVAAAQDEDEDEEV